MNYGYIRVSSVGQRTDRQQEEMDNCEVKLDAYYIDKQSGKDFNRVQYKLMIKNLKENDLVVIKSIDRLGRNYDMIIDEWTRITKVIKADILVLDMPLLDTRQRADNLMGKFISDIVLQILSFVAQNEREAIKQRQAEGILIAKKKGVVFGRPCQPLPDNFQEIALLYLQRQITSRDAVNILGMTSGTFYRKIQSLKKEKKD